MLAPFELGGVKEILTFAPIILSTGTDILSGLLAANAVNAVEFIPLP